MVLLKWTFFYICYNREKTWLTRKWVPTCVAGYPATQNPLSAPRDGPERKIEKEDRGAWRTQENCPILLIWTCCKAFRRTAQKRWALHLSRWITKAYPLPNTAASHLTACWGGRQRDLQRCVSNATRTADFTPRSPGSRTSTAATPVWWISRFPSHCQWKLYGSGAGRAGAASGGE